MSENKIVYYNLTNRSNDERLHQSLNMTLKNNEYFLSNFDRFYTVFPEEELSTLTQYVFMVRPDLNINDAKKVDLSIKLLYDAHKTVALALTKGLSNKHDFIPFLMGRTESLQIPDYSVKNYQISQPYSNILMPYPGTGLESVTGGSFDISFRDTKDLIINKFFNAWLSYEDGVKRNLYSPKSKYIDTNTYDYMTSIFYIICGPDGESIKWFAKYTGVLPYSVSNSQLSYNRGGQIDNKTDISFAYFMEEHLTPDIIVDFNKNGQSGREIPLYNEDNCSIGESIVGPPFIDKNMKLKWTYPVNK